MGWAAAFYLATSVNNGNLSKDPGVLVPMSPAEARSNRMVMIGFLTISAILAIGMIAFMIFRS